jgi:hypothetical protein
MKNIVDSLTDNSIPEGWIKHPVLQLLLNVRSEYEKNRFAHISWSEMKHILRFFWATDEDIRKLEYSGDFLWKDPTLPFRESRNGRFLINFEENNISRLEFRPFVLSREEDFVRDDSGILRHFRGIQDDFQLNTAFQALQKFQSCILQWIDVRRRSNLVDPDTKWISTVFQLRTITTLELIGEPAKEGVHSDGVEHTMTTLLSSQNMTADSVVSQMHSQDQKTGIAWNEVNPNHIVWEFQHKNFLDTLIIVDNELKHSVSPVSALEKKCRTYRDMIIFFTRRPKSESHSTYKYDSLNPHIEIPHQFSII